ncbi:RAMP superfamily CRISPR-associated protein [uncultured Clostridium sp.]|uniref:RAMP superfamily CRISPR-associated protein n=1 Tax=uncultured Clostridium sp. TaxID=59620 RepID=UPI00258BF064|nr:RAMP superfamily CRISPR-associated protein [uncultured Clostridium sp.]MDU1350323.1 RAMP superfamily CRISPR-associated protein [Clostridium argentinense]
MKKKYKIEINLKSPMLIKSGTNDFVNSSYIKKKDRPFIPGSTLKGVVRSNFNSIVDTENCKKVNCNCTVCSIFGSSGFNPARIYFSDLELVDKEPSVSIRFHNSINRYLRKSKDDALFSEEVIEKGKFKGSCEVYFNERTIKYKKELLIAIKMIENIGSSKSRGYGFVDIDVKGDD